MLFFSTCFIYFQHAGFYFIMPFFIRSSFNMLDFFQHAGFSSTIFQHAVFIPSTCLFFLQQFEHAGFRNSIFQHALFCLSSLFCLSKTKFRKLSLETNQFDSGSEPGTNKKEKEYMNKSVENRNHKADPLQMMMSFD